MKNTIQKTIVFNNEEITDIEFTLKVLNSVIEYPDMTTHKLIKMAIDLGLQELKGQLQTVINSSHRDFSEVTLWVKASERLPLKN